MSACLDPAQTVQVPETWPEYNEIEREYVEPRLSEIAETPEPEDAVLFVGDSITQAADLASLFPGQPMVSAPSRSTLRPTGRTRLQ